MQAPEVKLPPSVAERYETVHVLGQGGMGVVLLARDRRLGRTVAIKLLRPMNVTAHVGMQILVDRFRREWTLLAALETPSVVRMYDCGLEDSIPYMILEYVEGASLEDILANGPMPLTRGVNLMATVAEALVQVHAAGILHRDLKPGNIIVEASGAPRILDFGLGAFVARTDLTTLTETGYMVGTLSYLPPEYICGGDYTVRGEIYETGMILYGVLTGRLPFDSVIPGVIIEQASGRSGSPLPPPSTFNPLVPPNLDALVMAAIHRDPARRPADAGALARGLRRWLAATTATEVLASSAPRRRPATTTKDEPTIPRRPLPAAASWRRPALVLGSLIVLLTLAGFLLAPAGPAAEPAWARAMSFTTTPVRVAVAFETPAPIRLRHVLRESGPEGTVVTQGAESGAERTHEVVVSGLAPGGTYVLSLLAPDVDVTRTLTLPPLSLLPGSLVACAGGRLVARLRTDAEVPLRLALRSPSGTSSHEVPPGGRLQAASAAVPLQGGAPVAWTLSHGETTVATGVTAVGVPFGPRPPDLPAEPPGEDWNVALPAAGPVWAGSYLAQITQGGLVHVTGAAGSLRHAWSFAFPPRSARRTVRPTALTALPDGRIWACSTEADGLTVAILDPVSRALRWSMPHGADDPDRGCLVRDDVPWNRPLSSAARITWHPLPRRNFFPFGLAHLRGGTMELLGTTPQGPAAVLSLQLSDDSPGPDLPVVEPPKGRWQFPIGSSRIVGRHLAFFRTTADRGADGCVDMTLVALPRDGGGRGVSLAFRTPSTFIEPAVDGSDLWFASADAVFRLSCDDDEARVERLAVPPLSPSGTLSDSLFAFPVLHRGRVLVLQRLRRRRADSFLASTFHDPSVGFDFDLLTVPLDGASPTVHGPPLRDRGSVANDAAGAIYDLDGTLLVLSRKAATVVEAGSGTIRVLALPDDVERIVGAAPGPEGLVALLSLDGRMGLLPLELPPPTGQRLSPPLPQ